MTQDRLERWQTALSRWDMWVNALNKTRADLQNYINVKNYPPLEQIVALSNWSYKIDTYEDGVSIKKIDLNENRESEILTELYSIASFQGSKFINKEMNLGDDLHFYYVFLGFWTKSVLGYSTDDIEIDPIAEGTRTIKLQSRIEDDRVIDTVSWYHDDYELAEVIKSLNTIKWPFDEQYVRSHTSARGPHEQTERHDIEAILCCILRYKYKESFEAIAEQFGWSTYDDSQGKPMSNTLLKRLKRGRYLIQAYEIPIDLPTRN